MEQTSPSTCRIYRGRLTLAGYDIGFGRSMVYQRSKHRRLRIRHAALTLSTSALSKILLSKAGDAPEPQHVIFDEALGRKRPCKTIEECLLATNIKEQGYMNAPEVEYPILFARPQFDDVGLCGFEVEKLSPLTTKP